MSSVQNECVNRQAIIYVAEIAVRSRSYYARADLHVFRLASRLSVIVRALYNTKFSSWRRPCKRGSCRGPVLELYSSEQV